MKAFFKKFGSRKFIATILGIGAGVALIFGVDGDAICKIAGAVVSLVSTYAYIRTEGKIDAERIKQTANEIQEAVNALNKQ